MDSCPRCGAKNDEEAGRMCKPQGDDCPMAGLETTFEAALALLAASVDEPCPFCKKPGCPPDCMGHYP